MGSACFFSAPASALTVGAPAPDFTAKGVKGEEIKLENLKGKTVVMEWVNYGCPFVRKHYDTGNMQALQEKYISDETVWIGVISSAAGKEGYYETDALAMEAAESNKAKYTYLIRDAEGTLGKLYGATVTPHMFIIDKEGNLAYQGGIDDKPSADKDTVKVANNYVAAALDAMAAGEPIKEADTKPYGCSVKY